MEAFLELVDGLNRAGARFVLIGVAGANYYAPSGQMKFATQDRDLFLPADPDNLVLAWTTAESLKFDLTMSREPLDYPRDRWLASMSCAIVHSPDSNGATRRSSISRW